MLPILVKQLFLRGAIDLALYMVEAEQIRQVRRGRHCPAWVGLQLDQLISSHLGRQWRTVSIVFENGVRIAVFGIGEQSSALSVSIRLHQRGILITTAVTNSDRLQHIAKSVHS